MVTVHIHQIAPCALHWEGFVRQRCVVGCNGLACSVQLDQADLAQPPAREAAQHKPAIGADALVAAQRHARDAIRIGLRARNGGWQLGKCVGRYALVGLIGLRLTGWLG